jgi:hypothetical protein
VLTRVRRATGERISEVAEIEGVTSAQLIDQLISDRLAARHAANKGAIAALRKARERAAKQRETVPSELGGEG